MARKKAKTPFAVIDAETDPFRVGRTDIQPFVWGYYDGSAYHQFDETADMVEFISEFDGIIYAHNGGKFDFHFLTDWMEEYDELVIVHGRLAKARIGKCELRDSYMILPVRLADYQKDDIDYAIMEKGEREKPENKRKIEKYLKSDCVYLFELISLFHEEFGDHLTLAGASMAQWKKIAPLEPEKSSPEFYKHFAPYYYGGRVECFEKGVIEIPFKVFDINSAYPYAMMSKHPYSLNYDEFDGYKRNADFYRITAESTGAFPYRNEKGALSFPRDGEIREFRITGWEYEAAKELGLLRRSTVIKSIQFMAHMSFEGYVMKFFNLRFAATAAGDVGRRLLYKLFMNSLYGKFAANPENYSHYIIVPMDEISDFTESGWAFSGFFGDWALMEAALEPEEQHYYNVATGASVTGYVRAMLMRAIFRSDRVLYCDTDSVVVCGHAAVELGDKLGQWKDEGDFVKAGIAGKKLYVFEPDPNYRDAKGKPIEHKKASKGVRLDIADLWKVASGETVHYTPESVTFSVNKPPVQTTRRVVMTA